MNTVGLTGRLTKAPTTRYGGQDNSVAITRFTLAVDDAGGADFIKIKCLGRTAEWAEKWLSKGSKVEVTGKIKTGHYTKDGREVYYTEVLANSLVRRKQSGSRSKAGEPVTTSNRRQRVYEYPGRYRRRITV